METAIKYQPAPVFNLEAASPTVLRRWRVYLAMNAILEARKGELQNETIPEAEHAEAWFLEQPAVTPLHRAAQEDHARFLTWIAAWNEAIPRTAVGEESSPVFPLEIDPGVFQALRWAAQRIEPECPYRDGMRAVMSGYTWLARVITELRKFETKRHKTRGNP